MTIPYADEDSIVEANTAPEAEQPPQNEIVQDDSDTPIAQAREIISKDSRTEEILYQELDTDEYMAIRGLGEHDPNKNNYDTSDVIAAQFRQTNSAYLVKKAFDLNRIGLGEEDPDFNLKEHLESNNIPVERQGFFKDVKNREQFEIANDYYLQDRADEEILNDTTAVRRLTFGLITGAVDPINWIPVGRAIKYGSPLVKVAAEGAILGAMDSTLRGYTNDNLTAENVIEETITSGLTSALIYKGASKGIDMYNSIDFPAVKAAIKDVITPHFERWFELDTNGVLKQVSRGAYGIQKQKAKRWVWEIFNNSLTNQFYNSGDDSLRKLAPKLFKERIRNLNNKEDRYIDITLEERQHLYDNKAISMQKEIDDIRNKHQNKTELDREVAEIIDNTYIDESGNRYYGEIPGDPEQLTMLLPEQKSVKKTSQPLQQEIDLYSPEHISNAEITKDIVPFNQRLSDYSVEAQQIADKIINFWDPLIKRGVDYGALEEAFKNSAIKINKKVLTAKEINLPSKELVEDVIQNEIQENNIISLGHITRKYKSDAIQIEESNVRSVLYRDILANNPKMDPKGITDIVDSVMGKISGNAVYSETSGPIYNIADLFKDRAISVSNDVLLSLNVLETNLINQDYKSWRKLIAQTELNRAAADLGYKNYDALKASYQNKASQSVGKEGTLGDIAKATSKVHSYNISLLEDAESLFKGTYKNNNFLNNNKILKAIADTKGAQYLGYGGQMFLSVMIDIGAPILRNTALKGLGSSYLKSMKESFNKSEFRNNFLFLDKLAQNSRVLEQYNINSTKFDKTLKKVSRFQDLITGVTHVNTCLKQTVAQYEYSALISECLKASPDIKYLEKMGMRPAYVQKLKAAYEKYGILEDNLHYVSLDHLPQNVSDLINCNIQTISEQTILTPGIGNTPRYLKSGIGNLVFMFQSYQYMLYNNVIQPALEGSISSRNLAGFLGAGLVCSFFSRFASDLINGRETDFESLEFWKKVYAYSGANIHISNHAMEAYESLSQRKVSRLSTTTSWLDGIMDIIGSIVMPNREINYKKIMDYTPLLNTWQGRAIRTAFDINPKNNKKGKNNDSFFKKH